MKRTVLFTLAVLLTTIFFVSTSNAQSTGRGNSGVVKTNWVDLNGDGICDNVGTSLQGKNQSSRGFGKKDGTGNPIRPQDGTGYGNKAGNLTGTGTCTGTGTGAQGTSARGYRGGK